MFILGFPLLLIPFAIYNMIAFLTPGVGWTAPVATIHMMSGQDWVLTYEDLLIAFAILLLAVEIMKATRMGMRTIVDHVLAMALFIVMLIEFLLVRQAGTSTFFLLTMIAWSTCWRLHRQHPQLAAAGRNRRRAGVVARDREQPYSQRESAGRRAAGRRSIAP